MAGETLAKIRETRLEKIKKLREMGINPFPSKSKKEFNNKEIIENFSEFENKAVSLAGRLMSFRSHGHLAFGHIMDQTESIQLYIKDNEIENTSKESQTIGFSDLDLIDVGDFLQAEGVITKTQRGEISVLVKKLKLIAKSIRPLPDKWDGIKDKEMRYRKRYLDFVVNPSIKDMFLRKEKFYQANRDFLKSKGFVEVEVPILEHKTGGADARPFVTHHNDLDIDLFMRISTELYQKRLIGAGFEKVFTIGPNFRNEGVSDEHLQEYYQIEWYYGYADYKENMNLVKDTIRHIAKEVWGKTKFSTRGHEFDLDDEWEEVDYVDVLKTKLNVDIFNNTDEKLLGKIKELGIKLSGEINRNRMIDNLWKSIRKNISGPAFLINEPKFMSPLAKSKEDDDRLTERFHVIIAGSELGNGYSEINDPIDQLERFLDQEKMRNEGDDEAQMLDIDFIEMLEHGMPPVSGYGHSERLFWFFENVTAREGTIFPLMRPEVDPVTKEIYGEVLRDSKPKNVMSKKTLLNNLPLLSLASIDNQVSDKFEGIKFGYIVLNNVKVSKSDEKVSEIKKHAEKAVRSKYSDASEINESEILNSFHKVYKEFGVDPKSRLNSSEALIKRIVSGKGIYDINNVVDIYNSTSAEYELPLAAYDLNQIQGNIVLRFADEGETITKISESETTNISNGELVYADEKGVICMDFNFRDSDRTKITNETKQIIIFVDGTQVVSFERIEQVLEVLASRLVESTGGKIVGKGFSTFKETVKDSKSNFKGQIPSRDEAVKLLEVNVEDTYQRLHSRMVAEAMEAYAQKYDPENKELWYQTGLLHDIDFYKWPENHPDDEKIRELTNNSYPDDFYKAIQGHAIYREVERDTMLAKTLLAVDEISGLFYAIAKMRPNGFNMESKSVKKKFKDKAFAAKIDRSDIMLGVSEMGITIEEHISFLIDVFKKFQSEL